MMGCLEMYGSGCTAVQGLPVVHRLVNYIATHRVVCGTHELASQYSLRQEFNMNHSIALELLTQVSNTTQC